MYKDYLEAAQRIPSVNFGCLSGLILVFISFCALLAGGFSSGILNNFLSSYTEERFIFELFFFLTLAIEGGFYLLIMYIVIQNRKKRITEVAHQKPGFAEFYAKYEQQRNSENMAAILLGFLATSAVTGALQSYQMRQDIHEIVERMNHNNSS